MNKCQSNYSCANSSCKNAQDKKVILRDDYDTPVPIEKKQGNRLKKIMVIVGGFIAIISVVYIITKLLG